MKKTNQLIQYLIESIPYLKSNPDKLKASIDDGKITPASGSSLSHSYAYRLNLSFSAIQIEPEEIVIPIIGWLQVNQSELFASTIKIEGGLQFTANFANRNSPDYSIKVELTESINVKKSDSQLTIKYVDGLKPTPPYVADYWLTKNKGDLLDEWKQAEIK